MKSNNQSHSKWQKITRKLPFLAVLAIILQIFNPYLTFFGEMYQAKAATVSVQYLGQISYGGSTVGDFRVNGERAFCVEHEKPTPATGESNRGENPYENEKIKAALYYGEGGPASIFGSDHDRGTVVTSLVLSQLYTGSSSGGESIAGFSELMAHAQAQDAPSTDKSFSDTYLDSDVSGNVQRTQTETFQADSRNNITLALPSQVTIHNISSGQIKTGGNAIVKGGESFYLTAPLNYNTDYSSGALKGSMQQYQPLLTKMTDSNKQDLMKGGYLDPEQAISFTAHFEARKGKVNVAKTDSETGNTPQGEATFAGAQYLVTDSTGHSETVTLNAEGKGSTPDQSMMLGPVTAKETKAPKGYVLNPKVYTATLAMNSDGNIVLTQNVTDDVIKGNIQIKKYSVPDGNISGSGELVPLKGAEFTITDRNGKKVDTMTTDVNGNAKSIDLPYGHYTVTETKTPKGVSPVSPFEVFVDSDGKTYSYTLLDANITAILKVVKVDAETGKTIPAADVTFQVKDLQTGKFISIEGQDEFTTDKNGQVYIPVPLKAGDYELYEKSAPSGYVLSKDPIPFTVDENTINGDGVVKVEFGNMAQKGTVNLTKTGEKATNAKQESNEFGELYSFEFSQENLAGATFDVVASEDIITPEGTVRASEGEVVDTIISGEDGTVSSKELYLGKYELIETAASAGYLIDSKPIPFELTYAGENVDVTNTAVEAENTWQEVNLNVLKVAEQVDAWNGDGTYETSYEAAKGMTFGIYTEKDYVVDGKVIVPANALIGTATTDAKGKATTTVKIPDGVTCYAQEVATDNTHTLNQDKYPLSYTADDNEETQIIYIYENGTSLDAEDATLSPIKNDLYKNKFTINKQMQKFDTAKGTFDYYYESDKDLAKGTQFDVRTETGELVDVLTIDDNGQATSTDLPVGVYKVQESLVSNNLYSLNETVFTVTITKDAVTIQDQNGKVISDGSSFVVQNDLITQDLVIEKQVEVLDKQDANGMKTHYESGKKAQGNTFTLYDEEGNTVGTKTTGANGRLEFSDIPIGAYSLKETAASSKDYRLNETVYEVDVTATDVIIRDDKGKAVDQGNKVVVKNDLKTGEWIFTKTDVATNKPLAGAEIRVKGKNTDFTLTSKEAASKMNLAAGDYTYTETKAPKGYVKSNKKGNFTIQDNKETKSTLTNSKPVPKTGDDFPSWMVLVGGLLFVGAAGSLVWMKRKQKTSKY
uniref:Surface anchored protein n=1 Tax=Listeria seeligeri TaxID=1640 RepID=A0A7T0Q940_LISSE|nr:SpaA isopeptide-forming pilin-related protein [Listeria seeligeri]QPL19427.1 surface anchored protein [Listeria seeligeri]